MSPASSLGLDIAAGLAQRAREHLSPLVWDGSVFSGAGWELLIHEGAAAEYFLIGEEHGTAEIPGLAAALFAEMRHFDYRRLYIETSDPIAADLDSAAHLGLDGIQDYVRQWPPGPVFYSWQHEAELIADVCRLTPSGERTLFGLDYEVTGDRQLIEKLRPKVPKPAIAAFDVFDRASANGWASWQKTGNPADIPTFSLDPTLVHAVQSAWVNPDHESAILLNILAETLEINRLQQSGNWASNERRAQLNRKTLARLLSPKTHGSQARGMFKFGATHVVRGVSWTGVHDIGSMAAEAAALRGGRSFHLLVGGGADGQHGVINPTNMSIMPTPVDMLDPEFGLGFLLAEVPKTGMYVLDLRPLRSLVASADRLTALNNPEAVRVIHGFDALVVWNRTTATNKLSDKADG